MCRETKANFIFSTSPRQKLHRVLIYFFILLFFLRADEKNYATSRKLLAAKSQKRQTNGFSLFFRKLRAGWLNSGLDKQWRRWQPEPPLMDIFHNIKKDINQTQFIKQQQQHQQTPSSCDFHSAISRLSQFHITLNLISNIHCRLRTAGHTAKANGKLQCVLYVYFYSHFNLLDVVEQLRIV